MSFEEKIREVFAAVDIDGSGELDRDELHSLLEYMGVPAEFRSTQVAKMFSLLGHDATRMSFSDFLTVAQTMSKNDERAPASPITPARPAQAEAEEEEVVLSSSPMRRPASTGERLTSSIIARRTAGISEQKLAHLRSLFQAVDEDGSGTIGTTELLAILRDQEVMQSEVGNGRHQSLEHDDEFLMTHALAVMSTLDVSGDGTLNFDEFCAAMAPMFEEDGNVAKNTIWQAEVQFLSTELNKALREASRLRETLEETQSTYETEAKHLRATYTRDQQASEDSVGRLNARIAELERINARLKDKPRYPGSHTDDEPEPEVSSAALAKEHQRSVDEYLEKIESLQEKLEETKKMHSTAWMQQQLVEEKQRSAFEMYKLEAEQRQEALHLQLVGLQHESQRQLDMNIMAYEKQIRVLREELLASRAQERDLSDMLAELELQQQRRAAVTLPSQCNAALDDVQQPQQQLNLELSQASPDGVLITELKRKLSEAGASIAEWKFNLQAKDCELLNKDEELTAVKAELLSHQTASAHRVALLESSLAQHQGCTEMMSAQRSALPEKGTTAAATSQQLAVTPQQPVESAEQLSAQRTLPIAEKDALAVVHQQREMELNSELAAARAEVHAACSQVAALQQQLDESSEKLTVLNAAVFEKDAAAATHQKRQQELSAEVVSARAEVDGARGQIAALQQELVESNEQLIALCAAVAERDMLDATQQPQHEQELITAECARLTGALATARVQADATASEIDSLRQTLAESQHQLAEVSRQVAVLQSDKEALAAELGRASSAVESKEATSSSEATHELSALQAALAEKETLLLTQKKQTADLAEEVASEREVSSSQIVALQQQLNKSTTVLRGMLAEKESLAFAGKQLTDECTCLAFQLAAARAGADESNNHIDALQQQLSDVALQHAASTQQLTALLSERDSLVAAVAAAHQSSNTQIASLQQQLSNASTAVGQYHAARLALAEREAMVLALQHNVTDLAAELATARTLSEHSRRQASAIQQQLDKAVQELDKPAQELRPSLLSKEALVLARQKREMSLAADAVRSNSEVLAPRHDAVTQLHLAEPTEQSAVHHVQLSENEARAVSSQQRQQDLNAECARLKAQLSAAQADSVQSKPQGQATTTELVRQLHDARVTAAHWEAQVVSAAKNEIQLRADRARLSSDLAAVRTELEATHGRVSALQQQLSSAHSKLKSAEVSRASTAAGKADDSLLPSEVSRRLLLEVAAANARLSLLQQLANAEAVATRYKQQAASKSREIHLITELTELRQANSCVASHSVSDSESGTTRLKAQLSELSLREQEAQAAITALQSQLREGAAKLQAQQQSVATNEPILQEQHDRLKGRVGKSAGTHAEVSHLTEELAQFKRDAEPSLAVWQARFKSITAENQALQTTIATLQSRLTTHETKEQQLEAKILQLNAALDDLKAQMVVSEALAAAAAKAVASSCKEMLIDQVDVAEAGSFSRSASVMSIDASSEAQKKLGRSSSHVTAASVLPPPSDAPSGSASIEVHQVQAHLADLLWELQKMIQAVAQANGSASKSITLLKLDAAFLGPALGPFQAVQQEVMRFVSTEFNLSVSNDHVSALLLKEELVQSRYEGEFDLVALRLASIAASNETDVAASQSFYDLLKSVKLSDSTSSCLQEVARVLVDQHSEIAKLKILGVQEQAAVSKTNRETASFQPTTRHSPALGRVHVPRATSATQDLLPTMPNGKAAAGEPKKGGFVFSGDRVYREFGPDSRKALPIIMVDALSKALSQQAAGNVVSGRRDPPGLKSTAAATTAAVGVVQSANLARTAASTHQSLLSSMEIRKEPAPSTGLGLNWRLHRPQPFGIKFAVL